MDKTLIEVAKRDELLPGRLKAIVVQGNEIVLGNIAGNIYAVNRRCGHMNAPLERGTLEGYILTCPMHHAQFDMTTREALSGPVPHSLGNEVPPENLLKYLQHLGNLMSMIKTCDLKTYAIKIEGDSVKIEI